MGKQQNQSTMSYSNLWLSKNPWKQYHVVMSLGIKVWFQFYRVFNWKIAKVKGCSSESVHVWPHVGKTKTSVVFIKNCKQTAEKCRHFLKIEKTYRLINTFWLYKHGVKYAPILSYSLLLLQFFKQITLYYLLQRIVS